MSLDTRPADVSVRERGASSQPTMVGGFAPEASAPPVINGPGLAPTREAVPMASMPSSLTSAPAAASKGRGLVPRDVYIGVIGVLAVTWAMWVTHGGLTMLFAGGTQTMLALGQLTGLIAGLAALAGLALAARPAVLERSVGLIRMLGWHRWLGITVAFGTLAHLVTILIAYASRAQLSIVAEAVALLGRPWMVSAYLAGLMIFIVALTSWRRIRASMAYESWYFLHVMGYLAVVLALGHALVLGSDFASDTVARWWWISLYVVTFGVVLISRVGGLVGSALRPVKVVRVDVEADNAISLWVKGRLPGHAVAGQYFGLRVLAKNLWWQSHPISVSSAPRNGLVRFSIKLVGDSADAFRAIRPGTRLLLEGPYGVFTLPEDPHRKLLLLAAGSGVAPIRALAEHANTAQHPVVLVRASRPEDLWYGQELERIARERGGRMLTSVGRRATLAGGDPLAPANLLAACPDIAEREIYVCGPGGFIRSAHRAAIKLGVPADSIHDERFDY